MIPQNIVHLIFILANRCFAIMGIDERVVSLFEAQHLLDT